MTQPTERPAHLRLYADTINVLPLPGESMTVEAYEKVRDLLWADAKNRAPQDGDSAGDKDGPSLQRGSSLADTSRSWQPTTNRPETTVSFGFGGGR